MGTHTRIKVLIRNLNSKPTRLALDLKKLKCQESRNTICFRGISFSYSQCPRTSDLDDPIGSLAGDKAVASGNVSVDEVLLFQVAAALSYVHCHLDLLLQCQQCRSLGGGGGGGRHISLAGGGSTTSKSYRAEICAVPRLETTPVWV